jgi:transposase-like protein
MSKPIERVDIITGIQRRRRYTADEKVRPVEETMQPGMTVSAVARLHGVSPSLLFQWRRRMAEGGHPAFTALGGMPEQILYDRMRTAVLGEVDDRGIVYNDKLLALAAHYGYVPKACRPYRAETNGKVERPFRYVREDFFLARSFRNLDDLNAQFA